MVPLNVWFPLVAADASAAVTAEAPSAIAPASSAHDICRFMIPSPGHPPPSRRRSSVRAHQQGR
jgi:hypothetical protein